MKNARELPALLEEIRHDRGLSMEYAAYEIGTNRTTYNAWAKGHEAPTHIKWVFAIYDWADGDATFDEVLGACSRAYAGIIGRAIPGLLRCLTPTRTAVA